MQHDLSDKNCNLRWISVSACDTLAGHNMTAKIALAAGKSGRRISGRRRRLGVAAIVLAPAITFFSHCALADEGGVSFWIPGLFGSLAATPQEPGWSLAKIYYHTSVTAGADVARAREFTIGGVARNVTLNANLNLNVNATGDLGLVIPTYVFATPVLGGQASVSLMAAYGVVGTSLAGTLSGVVTGPLGNSLPFGPRFDSISDTTWGFGDLALAREPRVERSQTVLTCDPHFLDSVRRPTASDAVWGAPLSPRSPDSLPPSATREAP